MRLRIAAVHEALWSLGSDVVNLIVGLALLNYVDHQETPWTLLDVSQTSSSLWTDSPEGPIEMTPTSPELPVVPTAVRSWFGVGSNSLLLVPIPCPGERKGTCALVPQGFILANAPDHLTLRVWPYERYFKLVEWTNSTFVAGGEQWYIDRRRSVGQWEITLAEPRATNLTIVLPSESNWFVVGLPGPAGICTALAYSFGPAGGVDLHMLQWTRSAEEKSLCFRDALLWSAALGVSKARGIRDLVLAADARRGFLYVCCEIRTKRGLHKKRHMCPHGDCASTDAHMKHEKHFLRVYVLGLACGETLSFFDTRMDRKLESAVVASESGVLWIAQSLGNNSFSAAAFH